MPSTFRKAIEGAYGGALFTTALTDQCLQIYPLAVWEEIENKVNGLGAMNPLRRKFLTRANRFGAEVEMDGQGRILLKAVQRDEVGIKGEVVLIGCADHLELWPEKVMEKQEHADAFTDEDFATLGI